jgi:hemerythrin-like domain-containing protein
MNAIDMLKEQHREVEQLFEKLGEASGQAKERLFYELADALAIHTSIEERAFYPGVKTKDTGEILEESLQEHLQAKRLLADMLDMDVASEEFDAKCRVLQESIEHHVEEEESELFPKVKKICDASALDEIGDKMESIAEELRSEGEPRRHVPEEIGTAAQI